MRDNARAKKNTVVKTVARYHGSRFASLKFFNSDRAFELNDNYTISENNTASALRIMKAGSPIKSIGLEVELTCSTINNSTVLANVLDMVFSRCFPADFFRMEADGSLHSTTSESAAECVTQTFSKAWMRNNYANFEAMFSYFKDFGINSGDTCCGMHTNIGLTNFGNTKEAQDTAIRKFWYMVANNYDLMKVLVRREGSTTYCSNVSTRSKEDVKNMCLEGLPNDHYVCLNYSHYHQGRIEFRLVGGQKTYASFRNTMESVFALIEASKRLSWNDLDDITKIFEGCNQYVLSRLSLCVERGVLEMSKYEAIESKSIEEDFEIR